MKTLDTLVQDVYYLLENKEVAHDVQVDAILDRFAGECRQLMADALKPEEDRTGRLRLSAMGKPDRQLWHAYNGTEGEELRGPTYIKFLYGHLIEAMVVALMQLAGHRVTDQQKEVEVEGILGHQDCRVDGVLVDVKSCSSYAFKKFKNNELHMDDPFGYIAQLKAYAHSQGDTQYGWVAFDKQNGTLCTLVYDEEADASYSKAIDFDVAERVQHVKDMVNQPMPPKCYDDLPDGQSGNRKLDHGCAYCPYKQKCWPGLQTYLYANGPKYLTKVEREPRVVQIPEGF